jgi:hypothetical protein
MMNAKMTRTDHNGSFSYRQKSRLIIRILKKRCRYWKYIGWSSGVTFRAHTRCTWGLERLKSERSRTESAGEYNIESTDPMAKARLLPHVMANFVTIMVAYAQQPCEIKTLNAIRKVGQFVQEMGRLGRVIRDQIISFPYDGYAAGQRAS